MPGVARALYELRRSRYHERQSRCQDGCLDDLYKLATRIVKDQGEEIVQLQAWLEQWYGIDQPLRSQ